MSRLQRIEELVDITISLTPRQITLLDERAKEYDCSRSRIIGFLLRGYPKNKPYTLDELMDKILDAQVTMSIHWDNHRAETINLVKDVIARSNGK